MPVTVTVPVAAVGDSQSDYSDGCNDVAAGVSDGGVDDGANRDHDDEGNSAGAAAADAGAGEDFDEGQWRFRYVRDSTLMSAPASAACDRPSDSGLPQEQLRRGRT